MDTAGAKLAGAVQKLKGMSGVKKVICFFPAPRCKFVSFSAFPLSPDVLTVQPRMYSKYAKIHACFSKSQSWPENSAAGIVSFSAALGNVYFLVILAHLFLWTRGH